MVCSLTIVQGDRKVGEQLSLTASLGVCATSSGGANGSVPHTPSLVLVVEYETTYEPLPSTYIAYR